MGKGFILRGFGAVRFATVLHIWTAGMGGVGREGSPRSAQRKQRGSPERAQSTRRKASETCKFFKFNFLRHVRRRVRPTHPFSTEKKLGLRQG